MTNTDFGAAARSEWLAALKPGDSVATLTSTPGRRYPSASERTVARLTPTLFVLDDGGRFKRSTGRALGEQEWGSSSTIRPIGEQVVVDAFQRQRIAFNRRKITELVEKCEDLDLLNSVRRILIAQASS